MKKKIVFWTLFLMAGLVDASANPAAIIAGVICSLVPDVLRLARVLAVVMFIYGGAKYAFAADDPGGRKQGKSIAINALIGLLIVAASYSLVQSIVGSGSFC
ncbi:MAG: hypothetical protein KKD39_01935 [Candidatus Altiarchaeota archaeon]|nr:hypothetical protein [Candidatus Altiarchaeota archaeon]